MQTVVNELIHLLRLERISEDRFIAHSKDLGLPKVFGGQVIAQALSAAVQTFPTVLASRIPHSLHAYFLRPGDTNHPIHYEVETIRDGKSFSVKRVIASQFDKQILVMTISFQEFEESVAHQQAMPNVPGPEMFQSELSLYQAHENEIPKQLRELVLAPRPIEYRIVENQNPFRPRHDIAKRHMWIRSVAALPDNPLVHQSMLAYTSDHGFLETALLPHKISIVSPILSMASLDHAIWFHRPFRLDEWLLYVTDSPSASSSRGFVRGQIFNQAGELVASTAQEGLIRFDSSKIK